MIGLQERKTAALLYGTLQRIISSGVPIERGFDLIATGSYPWKIKKAAQRMRQGVASGMSIHEVFQREGTTFRPYEVEIIGAACESGRLDECLGYLARAAEQEASLKSSVIRALAYPVLVLTASVFIMPAPTYFTDGLAAYIMEVIMAGAIFLGIPLGLFFLIKMTRSGALWPTFSHIFHNIPFVGRLPRKIALTRFLHTFAAMYSSGVPVARCVETAARTMDYPPISRHILRHISRIEAGDQLSAVLMQVPDFPRETVEMIIVGEESGTVSENVDRCATFMEQDVAHTLGVVTAIIGPLVLMIVGAVIAFRIFGAMQMSFMNLPDIDG